MNKPIPGILISCEHAGNRVPARYSRLFSDHLAKLSTHQGFDIGAKELANAFARRCSVQAILFEQTRLLLDVNRSVSSRSLFSSISSKLPAKERLLLLQTLYHRYRNIVQEQIEAIRKDLRWVVHLSVHTFASTLHGQVRNADVGLLYDPSRKMEKYICHRWMETLRRRSVNITIRCNYPYKGVSDGIVSSLRRSYSEKEYVGIELEVNQKYPRMKRVAAWETLKKDLTGAFYQVVLAQPVVKPNICHRYDSKYPAHPAGLPEDRNRTSFLSS